MQLQQVMDKQLAAKKAVNEEERKARQARELVVIRDVFEKVLLWTKETDEGRAFAEEYELTTKSGNPVIRFRPHSGDGPDVEFRNAQVSPPAFWADVWLVGWISEHTKLNPSDEKEELRKQASSYTFDLAMFLATRSVWIEEARDTRRSLLQQNAVAMMNEAFRTLKAEGKWRAAEIEYLQQQWLALAEPAEAKTIRQYTQQKIATLLVQEEWTEKRARIAKACEEIQAAAFEGGHQKHLLRVPGIDRCYHVDQATQDGPWFTITGVDKDGEIEGHLVTINGPYVIESSYLYEPQDSPWFTEVEIEGETCTIYRVPGLAII